MSTVLLLLLSLPNVSQAEEMMSIKLVNYLKDTARVSIQLHGDYVSLDPVIHLKEGVNYRLNLNKGQLVLKGNTDTFHVGTSFMLIPSDYDTGHFISVNDRNYLGALNFEIEDKKYIRPINQLPLEDYLKGVVPFEVFAGWDLETLKSQAIAARTYASHHLHETINDTIAYQVYGGYQWEDQTSKAVDATKGEVLTYKNHLIEAFYSASNGGITEGNHHVWGGSHLPYYPIKKDPYDPQKNWKFKLHQVQIKNQDIPTLWNNPKDFRDIVESDPQMASTIKSWLKGKGYVGDLKILSIPQFEISDERNSSKRAYKGSITVHFVSNLMNGTLLFQSVKLENVPLSSIRPMIGGERFKSYLIEYSDKKRNVYIVKGKGYGHGVGMSQEGAKVMGNKGMTYKEILHFYFPGTKIQPLSEVNK
ncbi:SpoIID/LytB domain-containing protein [Pullulanibacillus sp. KACC 23026]|uniref:SpoIID/LytB domain-containing protein n=1 Tax=Pullulanibacillus sp. KACC 23026 TaxID=3028315 RepID=UPI0023AF664B|nr:SpoIID/LytB domain-containing protein [Pullulanibacillus sp. KACC 23026]WEG14866.1 SpoIID/LytB domain-containing protein [Pullulanibacillus sp. KACC 23026]